VSNTSGDKLIKQKKRTLEIKSESKSLDERVEPQEEGKTLVGREPEVGGIAAKPPM
jgi:hypothetical protein